MANYTSDGTLTVGFCDAAQVPEGKKYKDYSDGRGLFLRVKLGTRGRLSKTWIWEYELRGVRGTLGLGRYTPGYASANGLKAARLEAQRLSKLKGDGTDPLEAKREEERTATLKGRGNVTFKVASDEYLALQKNRWRSEATAADWKAGFGRAADVLGDMPMREIRHEHIARVLRDTWHDRAVHGVRLRRRLDEFFRWAVARSYTNANPAALDHIVAELGRRGRHRPKHFTALPYAQVGDFMGQLRAQRGDDMAGAALEFMLLTVVRTRQVVLAQWNEIKLDHHDGPLWICPPEHTKNGEGLEVPLASAAVALLRSLPGAHRPDDLIFPGARNGAPLGRNSIRRFGQDKNKMGQGKAITAHGFRSTFRDWFAEQRPTDSAGKPYSSEVAESALHHATGDATERAYKRSTFLGIRRGLMQAWADFLATPSTPAARPKPRLVA